MIAAMDGAGYDCSSVNGNRTIKSPALRPHLKLVVVVLGVVAQYSLWLT